MNGSNGTVIYNSNEMNGQEEDKTYSNRSKPYISDVLMNGLLHNSQPTNFTLVMFFFSLYLFPIFLNYFRSFYILLFVIPNSDVKFMFFYLGNQRYTTGLKQRLQNGTLGHSVNASDVVRQLDFSPEPKDDRDILLNREHSIKDLAQRLTSPLSPTTEEKPIRVSEMAGIVSKAKEELAKSKSKGKIFYFKIIIPKL